MNSLSGIGRGSNSVWRIPLRTKEMLSDDNDMLDDQRDNLRRWEVRGGGALHKLAISRALWPRGRSESYDPNECF